MKMKSVRYIPLVITVGQVVIFPYYILWLKQASLTFTLFTWLFAAFSFSAAFGYRVYQTRTKHENSFLSVVYIGMGLVYVFASLLDIPLEQLPYYALIFQVALGFLQGYHHAWHIEQKAFRLHAIHHYLTVGIIMVSLSFVKMVTPIIFIAAFGVVLVICGIWLLFPRTDADLAKIDQGKVPREL